MTQHPVMEIFGPTVQGEGPLAGRLSHFVRFGACDYRCLWCDSMHAVIPEQVRANARKMTAMEILLEVRALTPSAPWVTLSGGNPALHALEFLVKGLQERGSVAVETQGSIWRDWLHDVDMLIVSPKPPSSLMVSPRNTRQTIEFLRRTRHMLSRSKAYKGVVFTRDDYDWHVQYLLQMKEWGWEHLYLSAGTDLFHGESLKDTRNGVGTNYAQLCQWVIDDPRIPDTTCVLPQLHVVAWGHKRGV